MLDAGRWTLDKVDRLKVGRESESVLLKNTWAAFPSSLLRIGERDRGGSERARESSFKTQKV